MLKLAKTVSFVYGQQYLVKDMEVGWTVLRWHGHDAFTTPDGQRWEPKTVLAVYELPVLPVSG